MLGCIGLLPKCVGGIFGATGIVVGLGVVWLGRAGWIELREFLNLQARTIFAVEIFFATPGQTSDRQAKALSLYSLV
jgi:hypothetical protein